MRPRLLLASSLLMVCMSLTLSAQTLNVQAVTSPTGQPTEETQGSLADASKAKELLTGQEGTSPYSTDQPYIKLTTAKTKGKWQLTLGIKKADKGTAWADLNGNGVYDKGEENIQTYKLWKPAISSQTITIYGKVNWVACTLNELTELDVSQNNLITYLACDENQLEHLDLSHNSTLEKLYCNKNNLQELNLSAQPNLKELYCFDNPKLQALDLTLQAKLEELYTNRCNLSELKLSSHPLLKQLKADENKLTTINLADLPELQKLWLGSNQLTEMDLSKLHKLNEVQVQENKISTISLPNPSVISTLVCGGNPLKALDLSTLPALMTLDCSETQISELDISSCPNITYIYCYSNRLAEGALDKTLSQLPTREAVDQAFCIAIDTSDPHELNQASPASISQAKEKGWNVYDYQAGANDGYNPYQGTVAVDQVLSHAPQVQVQGQLVSIEGDYSAASVFCTNGETVATKLPALLTSGVYIISLVYQGGLLYQKVLVE